MASCILGDAALAASYDVYVVGGRRESSRLYFDLPYALCSMPYASVGQFDPGFPVFLPFLHA